LHDESAHTDASSAVHDVVSTALPALHQLTGFPVPYGISGESVHSFGRHLTVGAPSTNGHRIAASCARDQIYLYPLDNSLSSTSGSAPIACDLLPDLTVLPDFDGDGQGDVAAVSRGHNSLLILASRGLARRAEFPAPQIAALAGVVTVSGDPLVIAYVEPNGAAAATAIVAISARNGAERWRARGRGMFQRLGHPVDLGFSVGPDANGDGVDDIVAGASVLSSVQGDQVPPRSRCVELLSGADGTALWPEPFCQLRGGAQSVSLGPDVDGDHRADVAVSTPQTHGADPRVIVVSGSDAHVIRRMNIPEGGSRGFGWPVALGPDANGDHVPDLAVGSVGAAGTKVTLVSGASGEPLASADIPGDLGFPNLRLFLDNGLAGGDRVAVLIGAPDDGIHIDVFESPAQP
jgi:hypothetical protein